MTQKKYYNFADDLEAFPDAWLYVAYSMRGPGKTYSFLKHCTQEGIKFLYLKRTQIDIDLITMGDFSPFKPLNRDLKTDYTIVKLYDGISKVTTGGESDEAIGFCLALSAVHKYKGFDLSDVDLVCLDEFMPQLTERVNRKEGELLLDLYMTINRDREERGRPPLKLVLFANATSLYCPITDTLGLVDVLAEMAAKKDEYRYLDERGIMLHHIPFSASANKDTKIFAGMKGTQWADMAFGGDFSFNDFSRVKKLPMKAMLPMVEVIYQRRHYYIYQHRDTGVFYMCKSQAKVNESFDLEVEADQRRFYLDYGIDLKNEISNGNMYFSDYSIYNLLFNYNKIYKF